MTKVSWKRILQRAGNDLPSHAGRPRPEAFRGNPQQRPVRTAEAPLVAGELESELRRALQRAQAANDQHPGWEPIYVAQEMRHTPAAVPVAGYEVQASKPRGGSTARNFIALSLSAAVVGIGVSHVGLNWGGGGGGGGGGDNGGQQQESRSSAIPTAVKKDQGKLVETGYAIQPLVHPGNPTDIGPVYQNPPLLAEEKPTRQQQEQAAAEAAAAFKRDMEEAVKLFENKPEPAPVVARETPAVREKPAREAAPAREQVAAASPAPEAAPAPATSSLPKIGGAEEEKLLQRASSLMQRGDITGARLLFEHLAHRGSALGAFALGQSYDPRYLEKLVVRGLAADQKQADYWYARAAELGGTSAIGVAGTGRR